MEPASVNAEKAGKIRGGTKGLKQRTADFWVAMISIAWGSGFIVTKMGMATMDSYSMVAMRFSVAFIVTFLVFFKKMRGMSLKTMGHAAVLGLILSLDYGFIMIGMETTSASTSSFILGMAVVVVPLMHAVLTRKRPSGLIMLGVVLATAGLALLTLKDSLRIEFGTLMCMASALMYSTHIIVTDHMVQRVDSLQLGVMQLLVVAVCMWAASALMGTPSLPSGGNEWAVVLYLSLVCSAFCFVMQPIAQKYTTPEHTGLIFALEPVSAAVLGYIFLHEVLGARGYLGAALVLGGVLLTSLKQPEKNEQVTPQ